MKFSLCRTEGVGRLEEKQWNDDEWKDETIFYFLNYFFDFFFVNTAKQIVKSRSSFFFIAAIFIFSLERRNFLVKTFLFLFFFLN